MYRFASIIDQNRPVSILTALLNKKTIPHALLFTGIEGIGKKSAAVTFAMAANCTVRGSQGSPVNATDPAEADWPDTFDPCCQCRACRKIISGIHPDIIHIKPTGKTIRIAQIRNLCDTLAMRPYEANLRVVIIADAQAMNPSAGNALLKMLEEPPDRSILILTASQTTDLLPTIVSRCRHIRFNPVSRKSIAARLSADTDVTPEDALIIAGLANGSLTRAIEIDRSGWIRQRDWLIAAAGLDRPEALSSRSTGLLLAFAEYLATNKNLTADRLSAMITWMRDIIVCRYAPDRVINIDMIDRLREISRKISVKSLTAKIEAVQTAQKNIDANSNLRLTLEAMMLRLAKDCDMGLGKQ